MSVVVSRLTKRFGPGGAPAVEQVTFEAPAGAITTLLGPSGAGKSTVLRFIAGLEFGDEGEVLIDGAESTDVPVRQRGVGFVFQNYALFRHMTVAENVAFGLSVRKAPKDEIAARVEELLSLVQLQNLGSRYPAQLSGGQRQRVALARALAIKPRVLLLDEPFGALDARVRSELREWLLEFNNRLRITTLMVTHDQQEAFELSQRVVLMFGGRVAQVGTPEEVYEHPVSPEVAYFLGRSNVLSGKVSNGKANIGRFRMQAPPQAAEGSSVQAYVGREGIRLRRIGELEDGATLARIERVTRLGPSMKIVLEVPEHGRLTVELDVHEYEALAAREGDGVLLDIRSARLFVEDYSI